MSTATRVNALWHVSRSFDALVCPLTIKAWRRRVTRVLASIRMMIGLAVPEQPIGATFVLTES